ncbi:MAG: efflux transporter periplasmic adaptor subunit, partial [Porphyromonadaceae bacterium]|nr:efflux transporter periplasmic adaptor subunit [Porphyromonadaceae bacterium]
MDIQREKKSGIQKKHLLYGLIGALALVFILWLVFGNHSSTMSIDKKSVTISEVTYGIFNDYIRVSGKVEPISVVHISPEEGGIVMEKVAEEGTFVNKGDVIMRLSNSSLDLQILNAESEVAEKQNMLRNTQVTMQQDKLNNETEKANLDIDMTRKRRAYNQYSKL